MNSISLERESDALEARVKAMVFEAMGGLATQSAGLRLCANISELLAEHAVSGLDAVMRARSIPASFRRVKQAMHADADYAWGWHCNIAMASVDEGMEHKAANRAAARFMRICFDVDTTKHPAYVHIAFGRRPWWRERLDAWLGRSAEGAL